MYLGAPYPYMTDSHDRDSAVPRIDERHARKHAQSATSEVEVIFDAESDTVTFVSRRPENDETTTAWITVDAGVAVDLEEQH